MTPRELELYLEGREEHWARIRELLAWVQANLMNAHGGKRKVKPEKLLPKEDQKRRRDRAATEKQPENLVGMQLNDVKALFRERSIQRLEEAWLRSPEGLRLREVEKALGYGDDPEGG